MSARVSVSVSAPAFSCNFELGQLYFGRCLTHFAAHSHRRTPRRVICSTYTWCPCAYCMLIGALAIRWNALLAGVPPAHSGNDKLTDVFLGVVDGFHKAEASRRKQASLEGGEEGEEGTIDKFGAMMAEFGGGMFDLGEDDEDFLNGFMSVDTSTAVAEVNFFSSPGLLRSVLYRTTVIKP